MDTQEVGAIPEYVLCGETALRLMGDKYYRHAGNWEVGFVKSHGKVWINTKDKNLTHLNGLQLIPTTRDVWAKDNEGYIEEE
jgi:hypothetical protein